MKIYIFLVFVHAVALLNVPTFVPRISMSLNSIYDHLGDKIQFRIKKPSISVFDVFLEESCYMDDEGDKNPLYEVNLDKKGIAATVKAITAEEPAANQAETPANDEAMMRFLREKKYYHFFDSEIDQQAIPEIYYVSKEPCADKSCYFVVMDQYSDDLDSYYDEHCVDNLEELLEIFAHMASTVSSLHTKGIVHCNIALKRFLIRPDGLGYLITNFGLVNDNLVCKTSESGFSLPASVFASVQLHDRLDLVLKQDVYTLGLSFLELINKNTIDENADSHLNTQTLDREKFNKLFDNFGCMCASHIDLSDGFMKYMHLLNQAFTGQLKSLIASMLILDLNRIPDTDSVHSKIMRLSFLYKKMKKQHILKTTCKDKLPDDCLKTLMSLGFTRKAKRVI